MKKIISLLILIAVIASVSLFAISCGDDEVETPLPQPDQNEDPSGDSSGNGDLYDDEKNTWMDPDADWQGRPVPIS